MNTTYDKSALKENVPYLYLQKDQGTNNGLYHLHIYIKLNGYKIDENNIKIEELKVVNGHENKDRVTRGHPYYDPTLVKTRVFIQIDEEGGHTEDWHYTIITTEDYMQGRAGHIPTDMIQVLLGDHDHNHKGSSVGHMGDADDSN